MAESIGLFNRIIGAVRDVKLSIIDTLGDMDTFACEALFIDDELICVQIDKLKAQYKRNADELTQYEKFGNGNEYQEEIRDLCNRQITIREELAYLFSHNPAKIEDCLGFLKNSKNDFLVCLEAMKLYTQGNEEDALKKFKDYMNRINGFPSHFLACKMLGTLLVKQGNYKYAIPLLSLAAEKRPEDIEVHEKLTECYRCEGMDFELGIESAITSLLTCNNLGSLETKGEHLKIT